jgi:hypothetical protein
MRPEGPRSRPGGRCHQRHCATHRQAAASSTFGHPEPRTCRALPSPERSRPGGTATGREDPRASLPGMREEAGPPPPAPRGLCPAACAYNGGGGGGGEGAAWRLGFRRPNAPRGGRGGTVLICSWCQEGIKRRFGDSKKSVQLREALRPCTLAHSQHLGLVYF